MNSVDSQKNQKQPSLVAKTLEVLSSFGEFIAQVSPDGVKFLSLPVIVVAVHSDVVWMLKRTVW